MDNADANDVTDNNRQFIITHILVLTDPPMHYIKSHMRQL